MKEQYGLTDGTRLTPEAESMDKIERQLFYMVQTLTKNGTPIVHRSYGFELMTVSENKKHHARHAWPKLIEKGLIERVDADGTFNLKGAYYKLTSKGISINLFTKKIRTQIERPEPSPNKSNGRRNIPSSVKELHIKYVFIFGRRCPCCSIVDIINNEGTKIEGEFDHFYTNQLPDLRHTWLICKGCHDQLTYNQETRTYVTDQFNSYQKKVAKQTGDE